MRGVRVLIVSLLLLGLLVPTAMAHPKPDAAHIPHEIMPDDAAWAAAFGGTTFADLWIDMQAQEWGKVMELPPTTCPGLDHVNPRIGNFDEHCYGDLFRGPVPIDFNFKFMQGPARGVPSYVFDPTCGGMYAKGTGPGCYVAYKWSWKLRDDGYTWCMVSPNGLIFFPDQVWDPETELPVTLWGSWNYERQDFSREPPNNYIAPFWSNWVIGSNDYYDIVFLYDAEDLPLKKDWIYENGWVRRPRGRILYATLGEAPNRTFVVLWEYARDPQTGFLGSFQLQLFEGSNAILFLFDGFVGKPGSPDFYIAAHPVVIGMEDVFGVTYIGDLYRPQWERMPNPVAEMSMRGFVY